MSTEENLGKTIKTPNIAMLFGQAILLANVQVEGTLVIDFLDTAGSALITLSLLNSSAHHLDIKFAVEADCDVSVGAGGDLGNLRDEGIVESIASAIKSVLANAQNEQSVSAGLRT
jgi:hypothetical protein